MLVVHRRIISITSIVLVMCVILTAIYAVGSANDQQQLTLAVLDVGQGDAIFIAAPHDQQILVDSGPDRSVLSGLGSYMPFYDRTIELVIITHPHADHYGGLHEILDRYEVKQLYVTGVTQSSKTYTELIAHAKQNGVEIVEVWNGATVDMGPDIRLSVLAPLSALHGVKVSDLNESSIVAKLAYKQRSFLLTGDATTQEEKELLATTVDLSADVLKIGHHGSEYSTGEAFLDAVHPKVAAISAGYRNKFGHPHARLLKRLEHRDIKIFRTDQDGDIVFTTDGTTMNVKTSASSTFSLPWLLPSASYQVN